MTASHWSHHLCLATAGLVVVSLASCSKSASKAPRVTAIPSQTAVGGTQFALDLTKWVTSPDGQAVTYSVLSGGGTITVAMYAQTFDTVGVKTVKLRASDPDDHVDFTFTVAVQSAEEAVIQAGTGLTLLDRGTVNGVVAATLPTGTLYSTHFIPVSNSQGNTDTFKAAVTRGHVVYERVQGGQTDLFVFNPNSPATTRLGDDPQNTTDEKYEAKTSDNRVVFTSGTSSDPNLYIHNTATGLTREISAAPNSFERNAFADVANMVYFESGPTAQRDIYVYDAGKDKLTEVSTNAANEIIRGVVQTGGVVFSRDNGAGDVDLWFYDTTTGLTQVAADVSTTGFQARTLTYNGSTPNGAVVFTETVSGTDVNLYYWDSGNLTTTTVSATGAVHDVYNGATANNKIIYTLQVSGTDWDVHARTVGGTDTDLSGSTDLDLYQAVTSLNDVVIVRGGNDLRIWDDSGATLVAADSGATIAFVTGLPGGNVVYTKTGTGLRRWLSSGTVATVSATGVFAGRISAGNFVVKVTVSSQDDMHLWNEATDTLDLVSADATDEEYVVHTNLSGAFVFSRANGAGTYDLYVWDATSGVRRISATALTHTPAGTYSLDNR